MILVIKVFIKLKKILEMNTALAKYYPSQKIRRYIMKKYIMILSIPLMVIAGNVYAEDGGALFKKKGCTACHHPTNDQSAKGLGPSIAQIKAAYGGNKAAMVNFLKGSGAPKVDKAKYPIMKAQLATIKSLSDAQLGALSDYMLK